MILWKPSGYLDINTDPSDLPQQNDGNNSFSEAAVRFKNLRTDKKGNIKLRDGSSKINETAFSGTAELVTNGSFTSDISSWTDLSIGGASIAYSSGAMLLSATSGTSIAQQTITITDTSTEHTISFDVVVDSGTSNVDVSIGTTSGGSELLGPTTYSTSGTYTGTFTPATTTVYLRYTHRTSMVDVKIDNVSIMKSVEPVNLIVEQGGVRYEFAGTRIFRNESSLATGLTDAQWSAIQYNAFNDSNQSIFALNGTDRKRITASTVAEWGATAPSSVTTAVGSLTGLTGTYNAKITYCRKVGSTVVYETNPSSAGTARALTNQSLSISWTASSDSQITHVRVYRTLANGSVYYRDQDVAIGSTSVDSNTADASLGDQVGTDHDRPPLGSMVIGPAYDGTCFILKDNLLHYCKPKQPEYWPSDYYIEVSQLQFPLKTSVFHEGQLHCLSAEDIFYIQGTGHGTIFPIKMKALTGAQSIFGAVSVKGKGIYHTGPDGIYLFSGVDTKITEPTLEPIFRGEDAQGMPGVSSMSTSWLHQNGNKLYFGYTSSGYDYPTNIIVLNLDNNRISYHEYDDGDVVSIRCITNDKTNNRILVGDTSGFVRVVENKSVTTDSGEGISWETQSKDFELQTRAHFPRWNKYDVDASSATSCTATTLLDGSEFKTHAITGNRDTARRLLLTGNGNRQAVKLSGVGPISIYAVEME
jgi:hypothetical protein